MSCVADFTVTVPSSASVGASSVFTAQSTTNTAEVGSASSTATVAGAPSTGSDVPITIDAVEIDSFELSSTHENVRDMERGQDFTVRIKLTAASNAKDVEIRAFVTGFEFSSSEPISDSTSPFDVEKGVSYVKTLKLKLSDRVQEDTYRLRVIVAGRDNDEVSQNYRIKITPTDHEVVIKDLSVNPGSVQAGRAVLATVRIKNLGDKTENDVKISVSVPELGITATPDFVDSLKSDESATSEEFFFRIEQCVKPGTYDVKAVVTFEEGDKTVVATEQITVMKGDACEAAGGVVPAKSGVKIIYSPDSQDVQAGGAAVSYPLTIANDGTTTKIYTLSVVSGADWATVKLSPSSMVTVKPGDSQTVSVLVSAKSGTAPGAQNMILKINDQSGDVLKELPLSANVVAAGGAVGVENLVQLLQLGLIALIVVLVVVGLVVAFRRMKGPGEGEEGAQTYY
ncbi:MAG TPA: NEW3 domain-containing protein [Candidatus Nanoarchaeia archaeon]|nr:NEW3 domain-containing protein [Candidatus Nanoarchaeia archaeon]